MDLRELMARTDRTVFAVRAAAALSGEDSGFIDCPLCGGRVTWGRAPNGHLHLACSTKGCVEVME